MNIVFASHSPFDPHLVVGSHQLARECARLGHRVLHLSAPVTPLHCVRMSDRQTRDRIHRMLSGPMEVQSKLWEWIPFSLVPWKLASRVALEKRNLLVPSMRAISRALHQAGMGDGVDLLLIDEPRLVGIENKVKPTKMAYRATDDYSAIKGDPSIRDAERIVCRKADKIFATSLPVANQLSKLSGRPVSVIENGVDLGHLRNPTPEHSSLSDLPHPRVVYVGAIDFRFDMDLVLQLAKDFPKVAFVNYGPMTVPVPENSLANLHFKGPLPYQDLPAVLQHCDVGILPMNQHPANSGRSPMKYYEYIAAGLPVLIRSTPEIERRASDHLATYSNGEEATRTLANLLTQESPQVPSIGEQGWEQKMLLLLDKMSECQVQTPSEQDATNKQTRPPEVNQS
jgi:Glycosyl transferases group 1